MTIDVNALAGSITERISGGNAVTDVSGDQGSVRFESSLDQARALEVLQRVTRMESRRRRVIPGFFGLQMFQNRGLCGGS